MVRPRDTCRSRTPLALHHGPVDDGVGVRVEWR